LFNALLSRQVANVAEYPFTTVEPNTGVVEVPDDRLLKLAKTLKIEKKVAAAVKFIDIAGLIKGAHEGEGLGNQFLEQIRQVDAILHLVRGFENKKVPHVEGRIDPVHDISVINLELALADFEVVEKAMKKARGERLKVLGKMKNLLGKADLLKDVKLTDDEIQKVEDLNLLTLKPVMYVLNLEEAAVRKADDLPDLPPVTIISAKLETEINELRKEDRRDYLSQLGLKELLLNRLIKRAYQLLNLITFFTVKGGKQAQAWPLGKGKTVIEAAEVVHTDFKKGFIKAEVINVEQLIKNSSWKRAKDLGKVRQEGRDYEIKDGEVLEFKAN